MNLRDDDFRNQLKAIISTAFQHGLPPADALRIVKEAIDETVLETAVPGEKTSASPVGNN